MTLEEQHAKNEVIIRQIKNYRLVKARLEDPEANIEKDGEMLIAMEEVAAELIAFCNQKIKVLNREKAPRKARAKKPIKAPVAVTEQTEQTEQATPA